MSRSSLVIHALFKGFVVWLFIGLVCPPAVPVVAGEQVEELLIGIEPEHNIFDQVERYRYLADYLSEQLDVEVKLTIMSRYGEVVKRFNNLKLDGAFLTSYTATMGIKALGLDPLVHPVNLSGKLTSQGYVFVRKDSGIRDIDGVRGKSIVFVDPATMEGYLFPVAYFRRHGITDMYCDFNRFYFSGSHASAIFAVLDGRADIGAAKSTIFNKLASSDASIRQELSIIAQSPEVPEVTLCVRSEINSDFRTKMAAVLLHMDKTSQGKKVLEQFQAIGFVKSSTADFVKVEEMARETRAAIVEHGK